MAEYKRFQLRRGREFLNHLKLEWIILKKEWMWLIPCIIMQYVHNIFHNWAYWIQGNKLSVEQRYTLYDVGFELMPELTESQSHWSEYLVFGAIFGPSILLVASVAFFRQNPQKPRFVAIILKRTLLILSVALAFRIVSFMVTALPGSAAHCRLVFDEECLKSNPNDSTKCVIPNQDFQPPNTKEIFFHVDALNGCGDLMFSSHTIYTLSFILTISKYWPHKWLIVLMVCTQIAIAFLIVASRKHYTLDVWTALYVVPLLWFFLEAYHKDINCKDEQICRESIKRFYGIDLNEEVELQTPIHLDTASIQIEEGQLDPISGAEFTRKDSI